MRRRCLPTSSGPPAVILSVGTRGGLSQAELASWVFGVFCATSVLVLLLGASGWVRRVIALLPMPT